MKRSEKQLSSKANFCTFLQLNCFNFGLEHCKRSYRKVLKKLSFKGCGASYSQRGGFQGESVTGYLGLPLVFASDGTLRGGFDCYFWEVFC